MKVKAYIRLFFLSLALALFGVACSRNNGKKPAPKKDTSEGFKLQLPWNYDSTRAYPLVVSLHGAGGGPYAPCMIGNDEERKAYPSFFMAPHTPAGSWGAASSWLISQIETLKGRYRIDTNRIYLIGFSMGGSGSFAVANAYFDYNGQLFAGIVRLAGQSKTAVRDEIARKTSVWYHIGLDDIKKRVRVARDAYQFVKAFGGNASAVESSVTDTIRGYERTTFTLTRNNVEIMKKSEYKGLGHDSGVPFADPQVLKWLFSQSLANR